MGGRKFKRSKEEREAEFVEAVEQILGFPLMPWQRVLLLGVRQASLAGDPINIEILKRSGSGR